LRRAADQGTAAGEAETLMRATRLVLFFVLAGVLTGVLAACQLPGPGKGASGAEPGVTPNAVAGDAIEVTALDAAPAGETTAPEASSGASPADDPAFAAAKPPASASPGAAAPVPVAAEPVVEAETAPEADVPAPPPKSDAQRACERKRGNWSRIGKGELRACIFTTRDGGKSCDQESDCEGACLARSRSCSPIRPLFGCNEILQDNGAQVTLCIE
jgi:hypothetical protein